MGHKRREPKKKRRPWIGEKKLKKELKVEWGWVRIVELPVRRLPVFPSPRFPDPAVFGRGSNKRTVNGKGEKTGDGTLNFVD